MTIGTAKIGSVSYPCDAGSINCVFDRVSGYFGGFVTFLKGQGLVEAVLRQPPAWITHHRGGWDRGNLGTLWPESLHKIRESYPLYC